MLSLLRMPWRRLATVSGVLPWPVDGWQRLVQRAAVVLLLALSAVLIGSATDLVITSPEPVAESAAPVDQVIRYAIEWRGPEADPLITLPSGLTIKSSNYRGVTIGDTTYFYNLAPRASFDPLARGEMTVDEINVIAIVGDPPNRVMIYTRKPTALSSRPPS